MISYQPSLIVSFLGVLFSFLYLMLPLPVGSIFSFDVLVLLFILATFFNVRSPPSLLFAWCLGFTQDLLLGSLLGEHAFSLTITAYMSLKLLTRMRFFSLWQQVLCVGCLTLVNQLFIALFEGLQGHFLPVIAMASPAIMNMALWLFIGFWMFKRAS